MLPQLPDLAKQHGSLIKKEAIKLVTTPSNFGTEVRESTNSYGPD